MAEIEIKNITLMETPETDEARTLLRKKDNEIQKIASIIVLSLFSVLFTISYLVNSSLIIITSIIIFVFTLLFYFKYRREKLKPYYELLKLAKLNDRIRHEERIRYRERKRLEETEPIVKPVKLQLPVKPISKEQK